MRILWRYVSLSFLRAFLGSLVILALVVVIVDTLLNLEDVLETTDTLWGAVQILFMRTASLYLAYLSPFAVFAGIARARTGVTTTPTPPPNPVLTTPNTRPPRSNTSSE